MNGLLPTRDACGAFVEGVMGHPLGAAESSLRHAIDAYYSGAVPDAVAQFGALAQGRANIPVAMAARALLGVEFLHRGVALQGRECLIDALRLDPDNAFLWSFVEREVLAKAKLHVFVEMTRKCNYQCIFCDQPHMANADKKTVSIDFLRRFEPIVKNAKLVDITGYGEITIHPDFDAIVDYFTDLGVPYSFITNGSKLTEARVERLVRSPLARMTVSLNSLTQAIHSKLSYGFLEGHAGTDLESNLKGLIHLARHPERRFPLTLSFVVNSLNFHELQSFVDLAADLGVVLSLKGLTAKLNDRYPPGLHVPDTPENREYLELIRQYAAQKGVELSCFKLESQVTESAQPAPEEIVRQVRMCRWPYEKLFISQGGRSAPCCWWSGEPIGEIRELDEVAPVFFNRKYAELRRSIVTATPLHECRNCRQDG